MTDLQGNIGVYATLGTGYDFSGLWPGKYPTEAKFQWEPLYDRVSISTTGVVTVMNAPSLKYLSGGGASFSLSATDAYGVTGGAALVFTGKDKEGNAYVGGSAFFGVNTSPGADFTETCTYTIIQYFNIYDALNEYYDFIEGIEIQ